MLGFLKPLVQPVVEKVTNLIPDLNARKKAAEELEKGILQAALTAQSEQNKINALEAQHKSVFVAGWRPFIGWICGTSLLWHYIIQPIATWGILVSNVDIPPIPTLDMNALMPLIIGMLGMAGTRTFEKMKGVARNHNG